MIFQKDGFQVLERYSVVTDYTHASRRERASNHNRKHFFRKRSRKERLGASMLARTKPLFLDSAEHFETENQK